MNYTSENTDPKLCIKQVKRYQSLQPMSYDVYKVSIECLERSFNMACAELKAYPKGKLGLTLDSAKDKRWHELRKVKEIYQGGMRKLNRMAPKSYLLKRRDERRAQKHSVSKANECVGA